MLQWPPYTSATGSSMTVSGWTGRPSSVPRNLRRWASSARSHTSPKRTYTGCTSWPRPAWSATRMALSTPPLARTATASVAVIVAAVAAARRAGLVDHDLRQVGQRRAEPVPDPPGDDLARRVAQPLDLVEVVVVEHVEQRLHGVRQLGVVADPAGRFGDRPVHVHRDPVGVAVQPAALVVGRDVREPVGRLEAELLEDLHGARTSPASPRAALRATILGSPSPVWPGGGAGA